MKVLMVLTSHDKLGDTGRYQSPHRTCTLAAKRVLNEATPMFADLKARAARNIFPFPNLP